MRFIPAGIDLGRPFLGEEKSWISKDSGTSPKRTAGGRELIFRAPDGSPMPVDIFAAYRWLSDPSLWTNCRE
jgi:hypothetical protein